MIGSLPTRAVTASHLATATEPVRPSATAMASTPTPAPTATRPLPPTFTPVASARPETALSPGHAAAPAHPTQALPPIAAVPTTARLPTPPPLRLIPGRPQSYLNRYRLVTYYGSPPGAALGVLGAAPRDTMLQQLREVAAQYQALSADRYILPTYHMVVTIADPFPGEDGDFVHWMDQSLMAEWIDAAAAAGVAVILDVQPGYADLQAELERLRPYLYEPHVHLALDSEFAMAAGKIPGQSLGQLYAEEINLVQAELDEIALAIGLNRVLIIHQFDDRMVPDKEAIEDYPHVELVFDADGFGSPAAKVDDYLQYAREPGFERGALKLFYDWDWPLMVPKEVLQLEPRPAVIIYQ